MRVSGFLWPLAAVAVLACQQTSSRFEAMDQPTPRPVPLPREPESGTDRQQSRLGQMGMSPDKAAECVRGTGRTPEGDCVALTTRDEGYVQRVMIPGGDFIRGSSVTAYDADRFEEHPAPVWPGQPPRTDHVDAFWIDLHEVTRAAYAECVKEGRCTPARCPGDEDPAAAHSEQVAAHLPQTCVTHEQARTFCAARGAALPTAAQWEYAARGTDARIYPWGNELMDEIPPTLLPVGRLIADVSYFGILGQGTNASEWVADVYEVDASLEPFLSGPFRRPSGPAAKARRAFERRLACGPDAAAGCSPTEDSRRRHVVKVTRSGGLRAARAQLPPHPVAEELEGWPLHAAHPRVGFRCAAPLREQDVPLQVPSTPPAVPLLRDTGRGLEIFGGVAEAVSRAEARAFCSVLTVRDAASDQDRTDWRLPTRAEIRKIADNFRGPGPFWAADGVAAQRGEGRSPLPDDPWVDLDSPVDTAWAARCVRDAR